MYKIVEDYYLYILSIQRLSLNTASTYSVYSEVFLRYLIKQKLTLVDVSEKIVCDFLIYSGFHKNTTIALVISSLKSFGDFLVFKRIWSFNVLANIERPKIDSLLKTKVLSEENVNKILDVIDNNSVIGIRDKAFFELIYSSGLRVSEACNLTLYNLHISEKNVRVYGKGSVERIVPFGTIAQKCLERYILISRPLILCGRTSSFVFLSTTTGRKLSRFSAWERFNIYLQQSHLKENGLCIHTLRHCFATHMLDHGADLETIRILLGHSLLTTTCIYTHLSDKRLEECHNNFFYINKNKVF